MKKIFLMCISLFFLTEEASTTDLELRCDPPEGSTSSNTLNKRDS